MLSSTNWSHWIHHRHHLLYCNTRLWSCVQSIISHNHQDFETIGNHTKQSTFFVANVQFLQRLEFSNVIISFWWLHASLQQTVPLYWHWQFAWHWIGLPAVPNYASQWYIVQCGKKRIHHIENNFKNICVQHCPQQDFWTSISHQDMLLHLDVEWNLQGHHVLLHLVT